MTQQVRAVYDRTTIALHWLSAALAASALLIVVGLHAAAALFHQYVWRDGVLRRMLPMG